MRLVQVLLPLAVFGELQSTLKQYKVNEYNTQIENKIDLADKNEAVTKWTYEVVDHPDHRPFDLTFKGQQAQFHVNKNLDREAIGDKKLELNIKSYTADGSIVTDVTISITILDVNDNKPIFDESSLVMELAENSPAGTIVGKVRATDLDTGKFRELQFSKRAEVSEFKQRQSGSVYKNAFDISKDGTVTYNGNSPELLDAELTEEIIVEVDVRDDVGSTVYGQSSAKLVIKVTDKNDNPPEVAQPEKVSVKENVEIEYIVYTLVGSDADIEEENNKIGFKIDGDSPFGFNGHNLVVKEKLDFEVQKQYTLKVTAFNPDASSNDIPQTSMVTIIVDVTDENDPPVFKKFDQTFIPVEGVENTAVVVGQVKASDGDNDDQTLTYSLKDDATYFSIDGATGVIKIDPTTNNGVLDREYGVKNTNDPLHEYGEIKGHRVTVEITDDGSPSQKGSFEFSIEIEDVRDEQVILSPTFITVCENAAFIGNKPFFYALAPDSGDSIATMTMPHVPNMELKETGSTGYWYGAYSGNEKKSQNILDKVVTIEITHNDGETYEKELEISTCHCDDKGDFFEACARGAIIAEDKNSGFPWWIIIVICVAISIAVIAIMFMRRRNNADTKLEDPEQVTDHDRLLSPDDMGSEQKAALPTLHEEPTDNLGPIIKDAKQQADNEETVPNTVLSFEYEGRNSMISNISDLSDGDGEEEDINLDTLPDSIKRDFEASQYGP